MKGRRWFRVMAFPLSKFDCTALKFRMYGRRWFRVEAFPLIEVLVYSL
jgi:hypothetical protein